MVLGMKVAQKTQRLLALLMLTVLTSLWFNPPAAQAGTLNIVTANYAGVPSDAFEYVKFTVERASLYELKTSSYLQDCDTELWLFDSDYGLIEENDDYVDLYSYISRRLDAGTYYFVVTEVGGGPLYCHFEINDLEAMTPATTPSASFSFDGESAGKLMGTTAQMTCSLDGGHNWARCTAPSTDLSGALGSIRTHLDIKVKNLGDGVTTIESAVQTIDITRAAEPTTAGKVDCSTLANNDGKLTGVSAAMEYRLYSDSSWISGTGSDITGLQSGTYFVRVKATGTVMASGPQTLVINAYVGTPATTPSAIFSFDGSDAGKLLGTTEQMRHSLDGGYTWLPCTAPSTVPAGTIGKNYDIRVKDMGDGVNTTESQVQTIDITQAAAPTTAGKVDCSTLANNDGKLTGVTTAMEYWSYTDGTWVSGTGSDITGLQSRTYFVRVKATGTVLASDPQILVINAYVGTPATTPSATFSFDGDDAGKLLGTTEQMRYSLDGGSTWVACTAPNTNLSDYVSSINEDDDIKVKDLGDGVTITESAVQTIDITQAEVPTADKVNCATLANNDGKLTGVTTAMEYKLSTAVTWTSGTGSDITGLTTGNYYVRVKATGTVQASDEQTVTINAYSGTPAARPNTTFSFDGIDAGKLLGTTAQMKYSLDGGSTWIACTAPSTSLSDAVSSINEDDDIQVKDMGDGVTTIESTVQTINIIRANTPTAGKVDCTTLTNNDGKLTGVTTAMEYRLSSTGSWVSGTGSDITGLASGTYDVRVKTAGTALASDVQTLTINAYSGTPAARPNTTFSFDGIDAGKLLGTTAQMKYSLDGGSTWIACTAPNTSLSDAASSINEDDDIKVKNLGDGVTTIESAVQTIDITQAARPTLVATEPSTTGGNGSIPLTTEHEYRLSGAIDWISAEGTTSLAPGNYLVRVKATGTVLASETQSITLTTFTGNPESTPAAVADYAAEELTNLTADGSYAVNGTNVSADSAGKLAIESDWLGTTISLVKKGDGVTTNDSEAQSLVLAARPAVPACTATQPSASAATGTVSGITEEMQYSIDNGTSWVDGTGSAVTGLVPGTVFIRVKATGSAPASSSQTLTITAYSAPPIDEDSGSSSGNSGNPVPAPVTEISSGGSTTGSNLNQLVSTSKTLTVSGDDGAKLVFDIDALQGIAGQTADGISVELRDVSPEHQDNHPGKRVFTLTVSSGGKTISEFGGSVTVTLPYALQDGEEPEDVTVWYLADDGTMTEIFCAYDPVTGLATFQVSHFSRYVVGTALEETVPQEVHFSDVREGDWFHGVVRYVADQGLMGATSGASFSPQGTTTRSLLVTILWRLEHEPKATTTAVFSDVLPGESYAEAVAWGAENALVGGYSASRFGPDDNITREQLAVFLYRYAKYKGADVSARGDLTVFKDKPSAYARTSVQWAVAKGLLRGNGSSDFLDPTGGATRAQLAAILQRFIENVLK